jgi:hypothetical protein
MCSGLWLRPTKRAGNTRNLGNHLNNSKGSGSKLFNRYHTGMTSVYIGPPVVTSFNKFSAELGADFRPN